MRPELCLFRIEGRDEQRLAGVPHADPLALDVDVALGDDAEENVGQLRVQQVDIVHVQHAAVRLREQSGLKNRLALLHRLLHVDRPEQAVVEDVERHLHERALDHLRLQIRERLAARIQLLAEKVIHLNAFWVCVERVALDAFNGRQQPMQSSCHYRLSCPPSSSNDNSPHLWVHCCKQKRCLDGCLPNDERHWEGVLHRRALSVPLLPLHLHRGRGAIFGGFRLAHHH
mmetsp:Transcript_17862/g.35998  ORF Transcript_17862/g.35998 Transcript_17862/m.35998 type:complete len:229 (-) Transcript_17862:220-906(-)